MNRTHRKFETLIQDLRRTIEKPVAGHDYYALPRLAWELEKFSPELRKDSAKVRELLDVVELLRNSGVKGRQVAEESILNFLTFFSVECRADPAGPEGLTEELVPDEQETESNEGECREILLMLQEFAVSCFSFKRARDAFGGKRRAIAFEILASVGEVMDLPDVVVLARQALKKGRSAEVRAAIQFIRDYHTARETMPDESLVEEIVQMTERADSESAVFAGLDALVQTGVIGEFEAMDRLDDWRQKRHGD